MKVLVDTHVFLWAMRLVPGLKPRIARQLERADVELWLSVISLWEIRLKLDAGKLELSGALDWGIDGFLQGADRLLPMSRAHALVALPDPPLTKDPFDRLLLAQCEAEGMKLLTVDKHLLSHRLAVRIA